MKKALVSMLVTAVAFGMLAGCAHRGQPQLAPGALRLAMVTDVGGLGDKSFNDSAHRGLLQAQAQLGARTEVLQSKSASDYQPNLNALTNQHFDEIYAIGFLMNKDLDQMAKEHPQQQYAIVDAVVDEPNVTSITFKEEDGSFLAGALAAMVSTSHSIAFLGGQDSPLIRKFEAGYAAGAREIDPSTNVQVKYAGSFDDAGAGKEFTNLLFDSGADVVFAAAGRAGLGAVDAVKTRHNKYIIGVDSNQDDLAPGKVLTSMIKRVDVGVFRVARAAKSKTPLHGHLVLGLKDDGVSLTDFKYTTSVVTPSRIKRLEAIRKAIIAGTIKVPATREELATFKRAAI